MGSERLLIYKYKTKSFNPYYNLALERFFLDFSENNNSFILYFWQNSDTVVIGRNQEGEVECDLQKMKEKNIHLLRRETGGGAVFHDKNNLNFSFIVPKKYYDKEKSMNIIKNALKNLGFNAIVSGRNDVLVDNKKISGNAYYKSKNSILHHGTILYDTDFKKMSDVLTPDISKLESKGVKSVKSRVGNLKEIKNVTLKEIERAIQNEFLNCYKEFSSSEISKFKTDKYKKEINAKKRIYMSKSFLYDEDFKFAPIVAKKKFDWGLVTVKKNRQGKYKIFSDSIDLYAIKQAQDVLNGQPLSCPLKFTEDMLLLVGYNFKN